MPVKRPAALGLLFTLATCAAFACTKTPPPTASQTFDAAASDVAAGPASSASATTPTGAICVVDTDKMRAAMMAVGGTGTGLAQDATVQQIIALYGASIPQGGSGTGLCQDASLQALYTLISGSPGTPVTAATVIGGQTYNLLASDGVIRFDTSNNLGTATADMHAGSFIGQTVTFYWWAWSSEAGQPVPPTVNVNAGFKMVPYGGQSTSGAAGLVTSTAITTPGSSYTLKWDGTEWATP